jgi:hypothetical protein
MTIAVALALCVRLPGPITFTVLNLAVVGALFGELVGPAMLRRALARAHETHVHDGHESAHPLASNPLPPVEERKA